MNGGTAETPVQPRTAARQRFSLNISMMAVRLLIAFIISWFIILAFFATGAVSH